MNSNQSTSQAELTRSLRRAIESCDLQKCEQVLTLGAKPDALVYSIDRVPLLRAIELGFTEGALLLIDHGASVTPIRAGAESPLAVAMRENQPEVYKALVDRGAPINEKAGPNGFTPLMDAAACRQVDACRFLIERGADVNAPGKLGTTPLQAMVWKTDRDAVDIVRLLVAAGASTAAPAAPRGSFEIPLTAFQTAVKAGAVDTVAFFLRECHEDPEQLTADGRTMLDLTDQEDIVLADMQELLRAAIAEKSIRSAIGAAQPNVIDTAAPTGQMPRNRSPSFGAL